MKKITTLLTLVFLTHFGFGNDIPKDIDEQISRATIATIFGRPIESIEVYKRDGEVIYSQYIREDDGTLWKNKTKIDGSRIIWGSSDGRWRDHPMDSRISYQINLQSKEIIIIEDYGDGSSTTKTYKFTENKES